MKVICSPPPVRMMKLLEVLRDLSPRVTPGISFVFGFSVSSGPVKNKVEDFCNLLPKVSCAVPHSRFASDLQGYGLNYGLVVER